MIGESMDSPTLARTEAKKGKENKQGKEIISNEESYL